MNVITPDPDDGDKAVTTANEVIESEAANIMIEIEITKAVRLGTMLIMWRKMMIDGGFSSEWVEHACYDIFQKFFPPPIVEFEDVREDEDR